MTAGQASQWRRKLRQPFNRKIGNPGDSQWFLEHTYIRSERCGDSVSAAVAAVKRKATG